MEWVAPHMGTDVALMLGSPIRWWKMAGTTKRFWHVAHRLCRLRLLFAGRERRNSENAEWAAEICGVNAEKIRELAVFSTKTPPC